MLRRIGVQCVNENVRINEARLNGHRRRCRGGEGAYAAEVLDWQLAIAAETVGA
jgi:hypothetical protein